MSATMKDIARMAGVSVATVSKYINGGNVKLENKIMLDRAISELGYQPNMFAQVLKTNRTSSIGIVVPDMRISLCSSFVAAVEDILRARSYTPMVCDSRFSSTLEGQLLHFLVAHRVDGIIIAPVGEDSSNYEWLVEQRMPFMFFEQTLPDYNANTVMYDSTKVYAELLGELRDLGHSRIAVITGRSNTACIRSRIEHLRQLTQRLGMEIPASCRFDGDFTVRTGYAGIMKTMALSTPPTAVLCMSEEITMGAYIALSELGKRIPEDVSLIGVDTRQELNQITSLPLTMISQPVRQYAATCVDMIFSLIDRRDDGDTDRSTISLMKVCTELHSGRSIGSVKR